MYCGAQLLPGGERTTADMEEHLHEGKYKMSCKHNKNTNTIKVGIFKKSLEHKPQFFLNYLFIQRFITQLYIYIYTTQCDYTTQSNVLQQLSKPSHNVTSQ